jgi:hypothetical protein
VAVTQRTSGTDALSGSNDTSDTASVTIPANHVVVVLCAAAGSSSSPGSSSISGLGLTWTQFSNEGNVGNRRTQAWWGRPGTEQSGAITLTFTSAGSLTESAWVVLSWPVPDGTPTVQTGPDNQNATPATTASRTMSSGLSADTLTLTSITLDTAVSSVSCVTSGFSSTGSAAVGSVLHLAAATGRSQSVQWDWTTSSQWKITVSEFDEGTSGAVVDGEASLSGSGSVSSEGLVGNRIIWGGTVATWGDDDAYWGPAPGGSTVNGSATLTGEGTLTGTGLHVASETATLEGAGTLTATGLRIVSASATLEGAGTLTGTGLHVASETATLAGEGTLTATGETIGASGGTATLSGVGSITAAGLVTRIGTAILSGTGAITAEGEVAGVISSTATLSGTGSITTTSLRTTFGTATLVGVGTLTSSGAGAGEVLTIGGGTLANKAGRGRLATSTATSRFTTTASRGSF